MKLDNIIAERINKTIYRDGNKCIKVFDESYSKADVLNEALNHARVEETGLNIPELSEVTRINGKWAIVSQFIEGENLADLIAADPAKYDEYLNMFVDLQLEIHSKRSPLLSQLKDKMNRKIDLTDLDETTKYDLHTRLTSAPDHSKLCHGDYNTSNIIITPDGTPYVLDWAHATQGNASADAARTYLLFCLSGNIAGADKYLDLFCQKSGTAKKYVQSWMPIVAASQSVKKNCKEKEILLRWVNVVDYE
ncbi:phosphotransferase [Ruminococcus sp.]|uniref:phosphotransferase family protein n=1 Tax=Ruminococcus sp. TaxID=41978 RepID=UPI0025E8F3D0|nr:phosphotransferase [Ruminococcus sp.]MBQ6169186.1 phosphotransferase [Ruminococcus sp.]MBQ6251057.1 phosphotransferase [Ruminococcus sp.]MBR6996746.1 phosphotransferase [Ruminococcus sp.]